MEGEPKLEPDVKAELQRQEELFRAREGLRYAAKERDQLLAKISRLRAECESLRERLPRADLEKENKGLRAEVADRHKKLAESQALLGEGSRAVADLLEKVKSYGHQLDRMRATLEAMELARNEAQRERDAALEDRSILAAEMEVLRGQMKALAPMAKR